MYRRPGVWRYAPGEFLKMGDWMEKRKTVMLLGNGKRIIIKVKADKGSKKKKGRNQTRRPGRDDAQ
jgi:hypothetical protein